MTPPFHFFVVFRQLKANGGELLVQHVPLSKALQTELSNHFSNLHARWTEQAREGLDFDHGWTLDEDQVWQCTFPLTAPYNDVALNPTRYSDYSPPHDPEQLAIKAVLAVRPSSAPKTSTYLFQSCNQSHVISPKRLAIIFSSGTFSRLNSPGITISDSLAAVVEDGMMQYVSHFNARQFFDFPEICLPLATPDQIREVVVATKLFHADVDIISLTNNCDMIVRRRFSEVMASKILDHPKTTGDLIRRLADKCGFKIDTPGKPGHRRVVIPTDKSELKNLLLLLTQSVYQTEITEEMYVTNSRRRIGPKAASAG